jgi:hypothetical protein
MIPDLEVVPNLDEPPVTVRSRCWFTMFPKMLSRWHPSMDTEAEAIQSNPRFFPVSRMGPKQCSSLRLVIRVLGLPQEVPQKV